MIARFQITPVLVAIILYAPALKARFSLNDILLYVAPGSLFVLLVLIWNLKNPQQFTRRIVGSLIFLIPLLPAYIAFFVSDGNNINVFILYGINCALGALLTVHYWNRQGIEIFFVCCASIGLLLSYDSFMNYGSYDSLQDASEFVRQKYLPVAFASGVSGLAALYLFSTRSSSLYIVIFALNWIGLALSRGRGAVIVCALVSVFYLIYLMFAKNEAIGKVKKYLILAVAIGMIPVVSANLMLLNTGKWNRLLKDLDAEMDEGGRMALMTDAMSRISESPIIGNGLGQYIADGAHPHNIFLQFGVDSGFIGMAILLSFFISVIMIGLTAHSKSNGEHTSMIVMLLLMFVYGIANYMKSGDAYIGRDWIILASLPVSFCMHLGYARIHNSRNSTYESRTS